MFGNGVRKGASVIIVIVMVLGGLTVLSLPGAGSGIEYKAEKDSVAGTPVSSDAAGTATDAVNAGGDKVSKLSELRDETDGAYPAPSPLSKDAEALLSNGYNFDYHGINESWAKGYTGDGVNVAVVDTGVDFAHPDLTGTQAVVNDSSSPYNGWPIAYDPESMKTYIDSGETEGTWYANTSRVGPGPFEVEHKIDVDGTSDFKDNADELWDTGADEPNLFDYDLKKLYFTYDPDYWYGGFNIKPVTDNVTVGLLFDIDDGTSGSSVVPGGFSIDTNTSHSDFINQVQFSDDGTMLASVSDDYTIKIWDVKTGMLITTLNGHTSKPGSLSWAPDNEHVVSADLTNFIIWNITTGDIVAEVDYNNPSITKIATLDITNNGTWVAVGSQNNVHLYNMVDGSWFGSMWISSTEINTIAFNPVDSTQVAIGAGAGGKEISVYDMTASFTWFDNINTTSMNPGNRSEPLYSLKGHTEAISSIDWSSDALKLVSGGGTDNTVKIWNDLTTTTQTFSSSVLGTSDTSGETDTSDLAGDDGPYPAVPTTPANGDGWFTVPAGNTMHIENFNIPASVDGHIQNVNLSVQYDVNSAGAFTANYLTVGLDPDDLPGTPPSFQNTIRPLAGDSNVFEEVTLNLAINSFDDLRKLDVWYTNGGDDDIVSFDYIWLNVTYYDGKTLTNHTLTVTSVGWSADDSMIASSSEDATVKVWLSDGTLENSIDTREISNSVSWSPMDAELLSFCSNDLAVRIWNDTAKAIDTTFIAHKPDHALYINMGLRYDAKEDVNLPFIKNATKYTWNGGAWDSSSLVELGGSWAYSVDALGEAFVEFSIPRSRLDDTQFFSVEMFSASSNKSRAHDTVPDDKNAGGTAGTLDWNSGTTSLSNFEYGYIRKYTVDSSIINKTMSTNFHFGFHPGSRIRTSSLGSGLLVVESTTPGVYDKVYLDMNNDLIFDESDVNVTRDNPIAAYDNYNATAGAYVSETVGPDGIPDKSGGMLYFISQAKEVVAEEPVFSSDNKSAKLANGNLIDGSVTVYLNGMEYIAVLDASEGPEISDDLLSATLSFNNLVNESTVTITINNTLYTGEYTIDLDKGIVRFADPLPSKDGLIINYSYYGKPYSIDMEQGNISFTSALNSSTMANISVDYQYDGIPIPYSDVYAERELKDNRIPTNGDLIAFMGEFSKDPSTNEYTTGGTRAASAIVGQNANPNRPIIGAAPDTKIIAIGNFASKTSNVIDAWYFAVEGYDGVLNSGDEAQIVSNSFNYESIYEDGWDKYSRMADYISTTYSNGSALFVTSAGDAGYGYGSVSSPASGPSILAVGDATDFTGDSNAVTNASFDVNGLGGLGDVNSEGANPHYGEVNMASSRGPTPTGTPKPDIIAIGQGWVAEALSISDGNLASTKFWIGTAHSSALTAGAAALAYQAYFETYNRFPTVSEARSIIMSGAMDPGADVLTQGAGFLNISRSIDLAKGVQGAAVEPSTWVPGGFDGTRYDSFAKMLYPGESDSMTFGIDNYGAARDYDVSASTFRRTEGYYYQNETFTFKYNDLENNEHTLFDKAVAIVVNGTGVYALNTSVVDQLVYDTTFFDGVTDTGIQAYPRGMKVMDINTTAWNNADLVRVSAASDYSTIVGDTSVLQNYGLALYDWENRMGDYLDWLKNNYAPAAWGTASAPWIPEVAPLDYQAGGVPGPLYVNGTPECTFPLMNDGGINTFNLSQWETTFGWEYEDKLYDLNTLAQGTGTNVMEARVSNPAEKVQDGLVILVDANEGLDGILWNITIDLYEKEEWDWIDINGQGPSDTQNMGLNSSSSFTVTAAVPSGANVGSYEGAIYIENATLGQTITVPVLINVASEIPDMTFGGDTSDDLFNNNKVYGGNNKDMDSNGILNFPETGDWRFFYLNIPDQGLYSGSSGMSLMINARWETKPTDNDIFVFSESGADDATIEDSANFGPYTLENQGGSEEADGSGFFTFTDGAQEIVALPLRPGLNVIAIHNVILNGMSPEENIWGEVGWLSLSSTNVRKSTNKLYGSVSVSMLSNLDMDGTNASVLGPASSETFTDQEVWQESAADMAAQDAALSWKDYVYTLRFSSYMKIIQVEKAATLEVHIVGHPADDLDFAIFYDHNGNGEVDIEDLIDSSFCEFITYNSWGQAPYAIGADADGDEKIKLIAPPDGQYIIAVYGWGVSTGGVEGEGPPAYFDMDISMIVAGVAGYGLEGFPGDDMSEGLSVFENDTVVNAFTIQQFNVTWDFPGSAQDGEYGGVLNMGTYIAPELVSSLVTIFIDRESPDIQETTIPSNNAIIRDANPSITCFIEDLETAEIDAGELRMFVDGIDVTSNAMISADPDDTGGYPRATISYTPSGPMTEGGHMVEVRASDFAGNTAVKAWAFTVDTQAPALSIRNALDASVTETEYAISGETEPGAVVSILVGAEVYHPDLKADGTFSLTVDLLPNSLTDIVVEAEDMAGNKARETLRVTTDSESPTISGLKSSNGFLTRSDSTVLSGELAEPGTIFINGEDVEGINSDGSFARTVGLSEGQNTFEIIIVDMAGNSVTEWLNVTRDTVAPTIDIEVPATVDGSMVNITGTVRDGSSVKINGKLPSTTRADGDIVFTKSLVLNYGVNAFVIEASDDAGNVIETRYTINYEIADEVGTNWAAIGLMVALLIVGLIVGLLVAMGIWREKDEGEEPPAGGDAPEDESPDGLDLDETESEEEDVGAPVDDGAGDDVEAAEPEGEEIEEVPPVDAEPIPAEEAMPEELPGAGAASDEAVSGDAPPSEVTEPAVEEAPESSGPAPSPDTPADDERIAKLKQAYEEGKISQELYEKNLARLQGN